VPRTIRFHLDEHVPHAVAEGLRRLGIDVTTTTDANLLGAEDADQIAYGLVQSRVIFTEDDDFLVLERYSRYCSGSRQTSGSLPGSLATSATTGPLHILEMRSSRRGGRSRRSRILSAEHALHRPDHSGFGVDLAGL